MQNKSLQKAALEISETISRLIQNVKNLEKENQILYSRIEELEETRDNYPNPLKLCENEEPSM